MPDLQAALQSVLNQWEEPKEQTVQTQQAPTTDRKPFRFGITNNVTRVTFEYVQNNPAQTPREICAVMEQRGYKKTSVSSLPKQKVDAILASFDWGVEDGTD